MPFLAQKRAWGIAATSAEEKKRGGKMTKRPGGKENFGPGRGEKRDDPNRTPDR